MMGAKKEANPAAAAEVSPTTANRPGGMPPTSELPPALQ